MAARIRKHHQDEVRRFYVYEILDADGMVIYVGKGSGRRVAVSCIARGGVESRIVERFSSERAAYAFEVKRIAEVKPVLNIHPGGNGSRSIPIRTCKNKWQKDLELIGTRKYAARLLLACVDACKRAGIAYPVDVSKVDAIREVAYG